MKGGDILHEQVGVGYNLGSVLTLSEKQKDIIEC